MSKQSKKDVGRVLHECTVLPKKRGNGILVRHVSMELDNTVGRYSIAYINSQICHVDNGILEAFNI